MVFLSANTPTKTKGDGAGQASDLRWIEVSAQLGVAVPARGGLILGGGEGAIPAASAWRGASETTETLRGSMGVLCADKSWLVVAR